MVAEVMVLSLRRPEKPAIAEIPATPNSRRAATALNISWRSDGTWSGSLGAVLGESVVDIVLEISQELEEFYRYWVKWAISLRWLH
jgi:hypothetical protein